MMNERWVTILLVLFQILKRSNSFSPASTSRRDNFPFCSSTRPFVNRQTTLSPLCATLEKEETKVQEEETQQLSELDARVLNSMLDNEKLDLETEANMRKLLERGVAPKTPDKPPKKNDEVDGDGKYSSTLFKTLSSDGIWNSIKAKAGEVLETVAIFVANRVERDAKLLAAVGLFAWDRAKRDVARALPESGTSGAAVGRAVRMAARQLGDSSSFDENVIAGQDKEISMEDLNLYEELNTPMDEIKSVTQSILEILSGDDVSTTPASTRRGLRTVAPAGQAKNTERQRRAYKRRKDTVLKQEKESLDKKLGRTAGGVADAAWEMKRELQAETSKPGYRTEGTRKAIKAGAEKTAKVLQEAKEEPGGWARILLGPLKEQKLKRMKAAAVNVREELSAERKRLISSLRKCLAVPEETWLVPDVLGGCVSDEDGCPVEIDDNVLRDVVTSMICLRDELEADIDEEADTDALLIELRRVKGSIETITSLAAVAAGYKAADTLSNALYGRGKRKYREPVLLRLDELEAAHNTEPEEQPEEVVDHTDFTDVTKTEVTPTDFTEVTPNGEKEKGNFWFAKSKKSHSSNGQKVAHESPRDAVVVPEVVDAKVEVNGVTAVLEHEVESKNGAVHETDAGNPPAVEIVSDEDFEEAFGAAKSTTTVSEEEMELEANSEDQEESFLFKVTLRALDVVAFVAEKILTVGIPGVFKVGKTASSRFAQVNRDGLGYKGWKKLGNVNEGKKKY